ncbi:hypothetical protein BX85_01615 [Escherichia coli O26:H11 str. 2010C-5028]|nr:hypothetical protein BX85_01615 [Escherichia coli O26:H11 str. 2010C-5028]
MTLSFFITVIPGYDKPQPPGCLLEMDYIFLQYPGYFRFAKWMERLAQGIADGVIEVPKDH